MKNRGKDDFRSQKKTKNGPGRSESGERSTTNELAFTASECKRNRVERNAAEKREKTAGKSIPRDVEAGTNPENQHKQKRRKSDMREATATDKDTK